MKTIKLSVLLVFILQIAVFPQITRNVYTILGITVEGNTSADAAAIVSHSGLKINGEIEIPGDQTVNAIKRLHNLNIFSDIQIIADKIIDRGAFILIKVQEHPRIEKVIYEGYDELDEKDFEKKISFIRGQIFKPRDIYNITDKLRKLYEEEGIVNSKFTPIQYTLLSADTTGKREVTVTWRSTSDFSDEMDIEYDLDKENTANLINRIKDRIIVKIKIDEGEETTVRNIRFHGNDSFSNDELRKSFDNTSEARWWKFWSSSKFNRNEFEKDKDLLKEFYAKNGYRDFEILNDSVYVNPENSDVDIHVYINEGNQYKVRKINWMGNTVYPSEVLTESLDFREGDVYDFARFTQNLRGNEKQNDVSALYYDNGYLAFSMTTEESRVGEDSVDITIKIVENNRFKVGQVDIKGNEKTKDKVIRRELFTVPGDYFSRSYIFRSLQQLANLQYFNVEKLYKEGVDYRPASDSTVNLVYQVEEKSSDYLNASVGYSGAFGFSGAIGVTLTNFSIAEPFRLGAGQILNFNWQFGVGSFYQTFNIGFTEPWFMDTPTSLGFDLFQTRQRYIYELTQAGGTIYVGRRLSWPDNYFYIQGRFRFQYNDVIEGQGYYEEGQSQQYTLGMTISRTDIDNPVFPSQGSKISLNADLSGGPFLPGDVDYYKIQFKTEWYRRLFGSSRIVLNVSTELGLLDEIVSGTKVNPFEYFYMGGSGLVIATTSLRGYDDRTVGEVKNGRVVGGRITTKYTAEIRAALTLEPMPLYILAFAEAGNTYLDINSADFLNLRRSVGFGARILINPVGLIGFDYGYGFDRKTVDGLEPQWMFHFQFGKGF